ncbi:MAG: hypothetical protein SOH70_09835 [Lentilactobacillus sunkii]|jgi:hypothetical protein|uniref:hypothetical protein n=1 Tax=Lentilactobacillus sunkii TaxID=481719 RepID=UPI002F3515D1
MTRDDTNIPTMFFTSSKAVTIFMNGYVSVQTKEDQHHYHTGGSANLVMNDFKKRGRNLPKSNIIKMFI